MIYFLQGEIEEANKLIRFTHFSNPLFIINVIGTIIIGNKTLGILVLLSHYLSNFIIGFIYRGEKIENRIIDATNKHL